MMKRFIILLALFAGVCSTISAQDDVIGTEANGVFAYPRANQKTLAFPTAMGFGKFTSGGRGGHVVRVTNLEDDISNPPVGSLRWAVNQHPGEPITVVFDVSGWIILKDILRIRHKGGITIAGRLRQARE